LQLPFFFPHPKIVISTKAARAFASSAVEIGVPDEFDRWVKEIRFSPPNTSTKRNGVSIVFSYRYNYFLQILPKNSMSSPKTT
jgi:hypothetical protein